MLLALSYLVTLIIGCLSGYEYGRVSETSFRDTAELMVTFAAYGEFLEAQRKQSDAAYESALRGRLVLVDKYKGRSEVFSRNVYATDQALTHARLSQLALKRGAVHEAQEHLVRAESFCPDIGWKECSAGTILEFVKRLDEKSR